MQTVIIKADGLRKGDWFIPSYDAKPEQVESVINQWGRTVIINQIHVYDVRDVIDLLV